MILEHKALTSSDLNAAEDRTWRQDAQMVHSFLTQNAPKPLAEGTGVLASRLACHPWKKSIA
jgi:hypothetical protein